jgi:hypothetical protein
MTTITNPRLPEIRPAIMEELVRAGRIAATAFLLHERDTGERRAAGLHTDLVIGTPEGMQKFCFSIFRVEELRAAVEKAEGTNG